MMVLQRLREKFMVPTAMPRWWRSITFCTLTDVIVGVGPKPAPISSSSTSNDSGVSRSAHSA